MSHPQLKSFSQLMNSKKWAPKFTQMSQPKDGRHQLILCQKFNAKFCQMLLDFRRLVFGYFRHHRSQCLQANIRFAAFFKCYKICALLHRSLLNNLNFAKFREKKQHFLRKLDQLLWIRSTPPRQPPRRPRHASAFTCRSPTAWAQPRMGATSSSSACARA